METKEFKLPFHPVKGKQQVIIERPSKESVWYLVIDLEASIPLVNLKDPVSAKQVIEELEKQNGSNSVGQYVMGGYSKLK